MATPCCTSSSKKKNPLRLTKIPHRKRLHRHRIIFTPMRRRHHRTVASSWHWLTSHVVHSGFHIKRHFESLDLQPYFSDSDYLTVEVMSHENLTKDMVKLTNCTVFLSNNRIQLYNKSTPLSNRTESKMIFLKNACTLKFYVNVMFNRKVLFLRKPIYCLHVSIYMYN